MRFFLVFNLLCYVISVSPGISQDSTEYNVQYFMEQISELTDQSGEEMNLEELNDYMFQLSTNRVKINSANETEIKRLFWLTDFQVGNILKYLKSTGNIQSIYEIQNIGSFSEQDVKLVQPFITFEIPQNKVFKFKEFVRFPHQKIILRTQKILEEQAGFKEGAYGSNPDFTGNPLKFYSRYTMYNDNFSIGFTGEKDAGEEFLSGSNKNGFDFNSFHLQLNNLNIVKTVLAGDYKVNFGYGLVAGSAFSMGKTPSFIGSSFTNSGIMKYTSTDENNYLRGVGCTFLQGNKELSVFYSNHAIDANVTVRDSISNNIVEVSSLQTTGSHSTYSEIADEDAIQAKVYGAHFTLHGAYAEVGFTALINSFSAKLNPTWEPYNDGYFRGTTNSNFGLDYRFRMRNILWYGEGAIGKNKETAFLSGLQAYVYSGMNVNVMYRNYSRKYQALFGNAFGENTRNQNEKGLYFGINCSLVKYLSFTGYADFFSFPYLRYNVDMPSEGQEYMGKLTFSPNYFFSAYVQYRIKQKEENITHTESKKNVLGITTSQHMRFVTTFKASQSLVFRNRFELAGYKKGDAGLNGGYFITQDFEYSLPKIPVKIYGRYALFATESYDSRIYAYESDLLYSFSIPAFYDTGNRFYLMVKASPGNTCDIWVKYAITQYANKQTISSGLYEIQGNHKSEIRVQAILKF